MICIKISDCTQLETEAIMQNKYQQKYTEIFQQIGEIGRPIEHEDFCRLFQQHFPSSFEAYSQLPNERLFVVRPTFIQRWSYINGSPMIERLYLHEKQYHEEVYLNDD